MFLRPLTITVSQSIEAAGPEWSQFELRSKGTFYQSLLWCRAWSQTIGAGNGIEPRIVTARDGGGHLQFILPLQLRRRHGVRVLQWLGAPQHNYGAGLFAPEFLAGGAKWFNEHWDGILEAIGGFDAVALTEMPSAFMDWANPMAGLCNLKGPNPSFLLKLQPDFSALHEAKRSSDRRRAGRKHESGLAHMGQVQFGLPATPDEKHRIIATMFRDQQARLAELGIRGVFRASEQEFIHRLAELEDPGKPSLAPYFLSLDGHVLSVALGGIYGNGYWALISSLSAHPARKFSPGDIALRRSIEACCVRGLGFFDFASGDAVYKRTWADDVIELHAIVRGRNARGVAWAGATVVRMTVKRLIKTTPPFFDFVQYARRLLFGRRAA